MESDGSAGRTAGSRPQADAYVHGTDPGEQRRLSALNELINSRSSGAIRLRAGDRVLDVGAGLGQFTRVMARTTGVRVVGVEQSATQISEGRRQAREAGEEHLIEFREGDAAKLPLLDSEWGSFDAAHTRFLLEHVLDPLTVVKQMVRAVTPGGRVVLEDDDHDVLRLFPHPEQTWAAWEAYVRLYHHLGNDAYVGRKLVWLLHQAGARPVRSDWLWFGACSGDASFPVLVDNFVAILRGARQGVVSRGLLAGPAFDAGVAELVEWGSRPDAALWFAICWAEGVREA